MLLTATNVILTVTSAPLAIAKTAKLALEVHLWIVRNVFFLKRHYTETNVWTTIKKIDVRFVMDFQGKVVSNQSFSCNE